MRKVEQFYRSTTDNCTQSYKQAVDVVGLQPHARSVWVLNRNVHWEDGKYLAASASPFRWVSGPGLPPHDLECAVKVATTVEATLALRNLVQALRDVHAQNFPAALLLLGAQMLSVHYDAIFMIDKQVPATLAFGNISLGKTRAAEAAHSILGLAKTFRVNKITDKQANRLVSLSTLGFLLDDPSSPGEFAEKVLIHFAKGSDSSCSAYYEPKCTFTATLNMKCFEAFAAMPKRYGAKYWDSYNNNCTSI